MSLESRYKKAIYDEEMDRVLALVDEGADVAWKDKLGWTILHLAALQNDLRPFQDARFEKIDIDTTSNSGATPLHFAVEKGHKKIVEEILKREPNLYIKNKDGKDVFNYAKEKGQPQILDILNAEVTSDKGFIRENDKSVSRIAVYGASDLRLVTVFDFSAQKVVDTVFRGDQISATIYAFSEYTDAAAIAAAAEALIELEGNPGEEYRSAIGKKQRPSAIPRIDRLSTAKGAKLS